MSFTEEVCCNCLDRVVEPNKTKEASFYRLNFKIYCSITCYYEKRAEAELEASKPAPKKKGKKKNAKRTKSKNL